MPLLVCVTPSAYPAERRRLWTQGALARPWAAKSNAFGVFRATVLLAGIGRCPTKPRLVGHNMKLRCTRP